MIFKDKYYFKAQIRLTELNSVNVSKRRHKSNSNRLRRTIGFSKLSYAKKESERKLRDTCS
jgi:hypothetical protein